MPFALSPALVSNDPIDYATREGQAVYRTGIAALDDDNRFEGTATGLRHFLSLVETRAGMMGWGTILTVPDNPQQPLGAAKPLLTRYGELTLAHCREFVDANVVGQQNRAAQDLAMLYQCLVNSLTPAAWSRISLHHADYTVNGTPDGVCLLRVIIRESHLDTNATASQLRTALTQLDTAMGTYGHDIQKFNEYVQGLVQSLAARGQTSDDLLVNLFKGYKACTDHKFMAYIELKESEYEEGGALTPTHLMQLALNKYQARVEKKEWNAPSPEQQKILALEAELKKMKSAKRPQQSNETKKGANSDKQGGQKGQPKKGKPPWMTNPPTAQEKAKGNTKVVDKKEYHWCPKHAAWTRHKPSECKLPEKPKGGKKPAPATGGEQTKDAAQSSALKLTEAMATMLRDT